MFKKNKVNVNKHTLQSGKSDPGSEKKGDVETQAQRAPVIRGDFTNHVNQIGSSETSRMDKSRIARGLQGSYGNRYVNQVIGKVTGSAYNPVQAKLEVGAASDKYETEADSVAEQVVGPSISRKPSGYGPVYEDGGEAGREVEQGINSSSGRRLPSGIAETMGERMGADFSGVKIHTGNESDRLNHELESKAFTTGKEIFVRKDQYNPGSQAGQKLLAHELTHVVQQGGANNINGSETSQVQRAPGDDDDPIYENVGPRTAPAGEPIYGNVATAPESNPIYENVGPGTAPVPPPRQSPPGAGIYEQPRVESSAGQRRQAEWEEFERQEAMAAELRGISNARSG